MFATKLAQSFAARSFNSSQCYRRMYGSYSALKVTQPAPYVFQVELNRPEKRNALTKIAFDEIGDCFRRLSRDRKCRSIVLSGAGKMFCSGIDYFDLVAILQAQDDEGDETARGDEIAGRCKTIRIGLESLQSSLTDVANCEKPIIAAIHGACIGAAVDLIASTDIRFATRDAYFSIREVALGLAADIGTLQRLPKIIGNDSAIREMAYSASDISADRAERIGMLSGSCFETADDCRRHSIELATRIAERSPVAVQVTKQALDYAREHSAADGLRFMQQWNQAMLQSEDLQLAAAAVIAKSDEKPAFRDL